MSRDATVADVLSGAARWCVVCGERDDVLASLADGAVDVTLTDAPYNERTHAGMVTSTTSSKSSKGPRRGDDVRAVAAGFAPLASVGWWRDVLRVTRRWCVTFCALEHIGNYERASGKAWVRAGVWVRTNPMAQMTGDRPAQGADGVAIAHRAGRKRWNGGGNPAVWRGDIPRGAQASEDEKREHPTQKSLALMRALARDFSDPGEVIGDWMAGSGTTGPAALMEGRRVILVERDPAHAETCRRRCEETEPGEGSRRLKQLGLFAKSAQSRGAP